MLALGRGGDFIATKQVARLEGNACQRDPIGGRFLLHLEQSLLVFSTAVEEPILSYLVVWLVNHAFPHTEGNAAHGIPKASTQSASGIANRTRLDSRNEIYPKSP